MKRDMDLIRDLLLFIEEQPAGELTQQIAYDDEKHTGAEVVGHLKMLLDAGYVDGQMDGTIRQPLIAIHGLTMPGHDFIDSIRHDGVWNETKEKMAEYGGSVALATVQALAIKVGAKMLGLE